MICYLATYPRSGNSLVQAIVIKNFTHLVSRFQGQDGIMPGSRDPEWEVRSTPEPGAGWPEDVVWNEDLAIYRRGHGEWRRIIRPGPEGRFTEALRAALAEERNIFFVKTHGDPFDRYFEGERVIQIVRHPGPTLWSLFRYMNDTRTLEYAPGLFTSPPPTLEVLIEGHPEVGNWTAYLERWDTAAEALGRRYLRLIYGEAAGHPRPAVEALSAFLGLAIASDEDIGFEDYRLRWPSWDLRGYNHGYERYYTRRQLELMWDRHGPMALTLGCAPPDLELAGPDDQVRRLTELIAAAWRRGYAVELELWRTTKRLRNFKDQAGLRDGEAR